MVLNGEQLKIVCTASIRSITVHLATSCLLKSTPTHILTHTHTHRHTHTHIDTHTNTALHFLLGLITQTPMCMCMHVCTYLVCR